MKEYPKRYKGDARHIKHPVEITEEYYGELSKLNIPCARYVKIGQWIAANILYDGGLAIEITAVSVDTYGECSRFCRMFNKYHGYSEEEIEYMVRKINRAQDDSETITVPGVPFSDN